MHVLWLATKAPWPTIDGGRLVAARTIEGLVGEGHAVTVVTPVAAADPPVLAPALDGLRLETVAVRRAPRLVDALRAQLGGRPWTLERHELPVVRRRVAELARDSSRPPIDIVHVEQIQALSHADDLPESLPVVMRAQNVESDLWRLIAAHRPILGPWLRREADRLAEAEGAAVRRLAATVALTEHDAARLDALAGGTPRVRAVPAPVDTVLEPGPRSLDGDPPLVLFGSAGWRPNRQGAEWFVERLWPAVRRAHPRARLHAFGFDGLAADGLVEHAAPADSRDALADGTVLVVPLHVASGIRMKILEAWARGVPVIATSTAARGTGAVDGVELWLADDAEAAVSAVASARDPEQRAAVVAAGRERLAADHSPEGVARRLVAIYEAAIRG